MEQLHHPLADLKACMQHWSPPKWGPPQAPCSLQGGGLIWGGSRDNEWVGGGGKDWEERGGTTQIVAQVGWRWPRSALPFKEGKLMFFLPKHNIVREVHNRRLSPVFPCASVWVCAYSMCMCVSVWPWWPYLTSHPWSIRVGISSWSSFKVRLEFLKDTLPVNFTSLFRQRISLLTFYPASPSSRQLQKPWASSFDKNGSLEREEKTKKRKATHF